MLVGQRVDRGPHRRRVGGSGSAAAADDPSSGREHSRNHLTEVLGSGGIDEVALDALRQPRVRGDAAGHDAGRRPCLDQRLEAYEGSCAAVDADGIDSRRRKGRRRCLGRSSVVGAQVLAERHLGDGRQVARSARFFDRQ